MCLYTLKFHWEKYPLKSSYFKLLCQKSFVEVEFELSFVGHKYIFKEGGTKVVENSKHLQMNGK